MLDNTHYPNSTHYANRNLFRNWKLLTLFTILCWGSYSFFLAKVVALSNNSSYTGLGIYTLCYWPMALAICYRPLKKDNFKFGGRRGVILGLIYASIAMTAMILLTFGVSKSPHPSLSAAIAYGSLPPFNSLVAGIFEKYHKKFNLLFWLGIILSSIAVTLVSTSNLELKETISMLPSATDNTLLWVAPSLLAPFLWAIYSGLQTKIELCTGEKTYCLAWICIAYIAYSIISLSFEITTSNLGDILTPNIIFFGLLAASIACIGTLASIHARSYGPSNAIVVSLLFGGTPIISSIIGFLTGKDSDWRLIIGVLIFPVSSFLIAKFGPRKSAETATTQN
jgi:hypothetical protein